MLGTTSHTAHVPSQMLASPFRTFPHAALATAVMDTYQDRFLRIKIISYQAFNDLHCEIELICLFPTP